MTSCNDIRKTFLDFFKNKGHEIVPSSALVPENDPSLMFAVAGMVQFKNVFMGLEKRPYVRAASSQKCLRAGGKHNDLDNVGFTARHLTFFEMLGNFSFGDYFKEDAIAYAWELLTKDFALPPSRLLVTIYHEDDQAAEIWKKVSGFSDDKIIRIATSDNFWSAGDTGPCGPSSEIFFDHGDKIAGGPPGSPDEDGDRYVEIWNNVFMQYDQQPDGSRVNLPRPSIDTGMGLERITAVLQGKVSSFDIDLFRALIENSAELSGQEADGPFRVSHRVIADHLRASAFMICAGILPSNEGRGYVLRRIMRRGMRHAHLLGAREPLMYRLVPGLIAQMGEAYPELIENQKQIEQNLFIEEERFKRTLETGLSLLQAETAKLSQDQDLPGDVAFKLYDTYGFPLDLTQDVLRREQGRNVDLSGFETAMEKQKAAARKSWVGSGDAATEKVWFDILDQVGATEFLGYTQTRAKGQVQALVCNGAQVQSVSTGQEVFVVVNQTPFYAESGGQVGDRGRVVGDHGEIEITDCVKRVGALFVHIGKVVSGKISVGEELDLCVDQERRAAIRANHSATHLLHASLRRNLGTHIAQKGSLVDEQRLRFDISQPTALTAEDIAKVEKEVNQRILLNSEVETRLMPVDQARALGAMAMFGEKYADEVRVLAMGGEDPDQPGKPYSLELCGGTHVQRTGDIGLFKIVSESALAAGVRRVEAVTGQGAFDYLSAQEEKLHQVAGFLKASPAEAPARVEALIAEKRKLEKEIAELRRKLATGGGGEADAGATTVNGISFAARLLEDVSAGDLKPLADALKNKIGSGVVALASVSQDGKASLVVAVTPDLSGRFNAVDLVRKGAEKLGGKGGGGRPDMAQAGGPEGTQASEALRAIEAALAG